MPQFVLCTPLTNLPPNKDQSFIYSWPFKDIEPIPGQLTEVPVRNNLTLAIIYKTNIKKPSFKTKPVNLLIDKKPYLSLRQIKLAEWMYEYYGSSLGINFKVMLPTNPKKIYQNIKTAPWIEKARPKFKLNPEQKEAFNTIIKTIPPKTFLLHGITGSGKTEIYLQTIEKIFQKKGKQVIVLVPEIALTPQAIDRYTERFGQHSVAVIHSHQPLKERFDSWHKIRSQKARIIIGPRSALFAPVQDLGLIIIDEEHDSSYKQFDQNPRYDARHVAQRLSRLWKCRLILGSATPRIEDYTKTKNKKFTLLELTKRVNPNFPKPIPGIIIDMKRELDNKNFSPLSIALQESIKEKLENKEQIILFQNRRGASTFIMCRDCGEIVECPSCNIPLTYHINNPLNPTFQHKLLCHHCNHQENVPTVCPNCKSHLIKYFGTGTEKIELEVKNLFPSSKVARMDKDSTSAKNSHEEFYRKFENKKIDILVGTQIVTKGWDLTNVGLIGIISADTSLYLPDFRSSERTFQLITQVAGRTGRGKNPGLTLVQTYSPENPVIQAASQHDFEKFYKLEIKDRKTHNNPPFSKIIKLIFSHKNPKTCEKEAEKLSKKIKSRLKNNYVIASPCFIPKKRNLYWWQIIIKTQDPKFKLKDIIPFIDQKWTIDVDPESII